MLSCKPRFIVHFENMKEFMRPSISKVFFHAVGNLEIEGGRDLNMLNLIDCISMNGRPLLIIMRPNETHFEGIKCGLMRHTLN